MSGRFALSAGVLLASLAAAPLTAQQSSASTLRDTSIATAPATGAATDSALVELGRTLTALAMTLQTAVEQAAKNPEVRRAAVQTAGTAVSVAQRALAENTGQLERLLAEASRRLADAEAAQKAKPAPATP